MTEKPIWHDITYETWSWSPSENTVYGIKDDGVTWVIASGMTMPDAYALIDSLYARFPCP